MLTLKINYFIHLLLNSKYRILFTFIAYILIYTLLKNTNSAYCMTEDHTLPIVAEAKNTIKPSEQVIALRRNIQAYAGSIASLLKSRDQIIENAKQEIEELNLMVNLQHTELRELKRINQNLLKETSEQFSEIAIKDSEIEHLKTSIEGKNTSGFVHVEGYKEKITKLEQQVLELRHNLHISETLLAEAKRDKDRMYEIIERAINHKK